MRIVQSSLLSVLAALAVVSSVNAEAGLRPRRERIGDLRELRDYLEETEGDQGIVGGAAVGDTWYSWQARFQNFAGTAFCGGGFVNANRILTSAKCIQYLFGSIEAGVGSTVSVGWTGTTFSQTFTVSCFLAHPDYVDSTSTTTVQNDVAVAILSADISGLNPVQLGINNLAGYTAGTSSFGTSQKWSIGGIGTTTSGGTTASSVLNNVTVPYVALSTCQGYYGNQLRTDGSHFCAGAVNSGAGPCFGDFGGLLVGYEDGFISGGSGFLAVGIYSQNEIAGSCGTQPAVFTDILFYYSSFIQNAVDPSVTTCANTPAPTIGTTAPTACPTCACFSEEATVQVLPPSISPHDPETLPMKELRVGQQVFAGYQEDSHSSWLGRFGGSRNPKPKTPVYETVYGFGHRNEDKEEEYVRITTKDTKGKPLEISGAHLIFVDGKSHPVRADTLQVGDKLLHKSLDHDSTAPSSITRITKVTRKGVYQPLTKDGTILVDGVETSNYVSVEGVAPTMVRFGRRFFSEHYGFHWCMAPYRFVCTKVAPQWCVNDYNLEQEGINHWLAFAKAGIQAGEHMPTWLMVLYFTVVMALCGVVMFLDNVLEGDVWCVSALVLGLGLYCFSQARKPASGKAKIE